MNKKQFKKLQQITPSQEWKASSRKNIMAQVHFESFNNADKKIHSNNAKRVGVVVNPFSWMQPSLAVVLLGVIILGSSVASVGATMGSLPGDRLYPIKRTIENVQVAITPSIEEKAKIELSLASKRVEELQEVTSRAKDEEDTEKASNRVKQALNEVTKQVQIAHEAVEKVKEDSEDSAEKIAVALDLTKRSQHIEGIIEETVSSLSEDVREEVDGEVIQVLDGVDESSLSGIDSVIALVEDEEKVEEFLADHVEDLQVKVEKATTALAQALLTEEQAEQFRLEIEALTQITEGELIDTTGSTISFGLPEQPVEVIPTLTPVEALEQNSAAQELIEDIADSLVFLQEEEPTQSLLDAIQTLQDKLSNAKETTSILNEYKQSLGILIIPEVSDESNAVDLVTEEDSALPAENTEVDSNTEQTSNEVGGDLLVEQDANTEENTDNSALEAENSDNNSATETLVEEDSNGDNKEEEVPAEPVEEERVFIL
ncbi:MAG: hypothetical protein HOJ15_03725 [Candidatus Jacksonbacteria bacterium]|nr:hypothetical protein [Candidatus Jacksonbacteria bacterium]MBT6034207.1 hypothetical protein [Candidatus Jacksonbacteria bacterium]MBT6301509.1 hypothetical protein [Candidatus Jacksonbacteria bacterium]MBT6757560.1 hypothetical protein [Candidatus Jacksonbacteria bacterium]MBT6955290.1 hypothetical protein [Candidatus Jacksonbacteria bacterium]